MSSSFAQIAARIQDSVLQLNSEKAVLELLKDEQAEQQALLDEASEECGNVRKDFLKAERARHGVELEMWQVEGKKQECLEATDSLNQETTDLVEYKAELQSDWETLVDDFLAGHQLKQKIYRHSVEKSIGQREELMQKRSCQLESLSNRMESLRTDQRSMEAEKKRLEKEIEGFKISEQEEDEGLSKTALDVKEMIGKRTNLRKRLRDDKDAFEKANEKTLKWEKECVELAQVEF